ncbi:MAG TPA: RNB domain-containing ribonuclease [Solirubrobacterales bacterium]|nr:RNB domain-containing ribonuclease [Solirubrobacterales bacterium]
MVLISKRGRFLVGELIFERGERIELAGGRRAATPGRMALVEMGQGRGRARVLRELGRPDVAADVIDAMLEDREVRLGFGRGIEGAAADAVSAAQDLAVERRDLRELPTFTVDPASARDFDDAVSASRSDRGVRLWIHIADVAAHVRPGDPLDKEARRRANSTYVPSRVAPMLPQVLSGDACSLVPGQDRLAVTAEIELSEAGEPLSATFYRSVIRSDSRLNYDELDEIFTGRKRPPEAIAEPLSLARQAAAALAGRRPRSSLDVESFEPEFRFERGQVVEAHSVPQTEAHRLIEHLMILTNERVAELLERRRIPTLYRIHEQPDPERIRRLIEQLAALDIPTPALPDTLSPQQAGELAGEASRLVAREAERRHHGREAYTSLVLRSLKPAQYSDHNLGHAGLGSSAYCHFTSPIRRYPDLIVHRSLLSAIGAGEEAPRAEGLAELGVHCSERERDATRIERDADSVCACFLLERELLERGPQTPFEGEVSGVVGAGAFVRFGGTLADVYEGFLPARRIGGRERYELDATETMLVGSRGGDALRIGDPVSITVDRVEAPRGRVDLLPSPM